MSELLMCPKFVQGEAVVIRPDARARCRYGWNERMDEFLSMSTMITDVRMSADLSACVYRIEADLGRWSWSAECFESLTPNEDQEDAVRFSQKEVEELLW